MVSGIRYRSFSDGSLRSHGWPNLSLPIPAFGAYDPTPVITGMNGTYSAVKLATATDRTHAGQVVTLGTTTGFTTPGTYTGFEAGRWVMSSTATGNWTLQSCLGTGIISESLSGDVAVFMHDDTGTATLNLTDCSSVVQSGAENLYLNNYMGHDIVTTRCYGYGGCDILDVRNSHNNGGAVNWTDYGSYFGQYTGFLVDPEHSNGPSHNDCAQIFGGSNVHFYGTHLDGFVNTVLGDGSRWAGATTYSSNGGLQGNSCIQTNVTTGAISGVGFHNIFVSGGNIPINFNNANNGTWVNSTMYFDELSGTYQNNMNTADSIITKGPFQSGSGGTYITTVGPNLYADGTTVTIHTN